MKGKCSYNAIYNRTGKLNKNGKSVVQIRVYQNLGAKTIQKLFSTGIYILPNQWNEKKSIIVNHANAVNLNAQISEQINNFEHFELSILNAGKDFNINMLLEFVKGKYTQSFITFCENEMLNSTLKKSSVKTLQASINDLKLYKNEIYFNEINYELVQSFNVWLQKRKLHPNTIYRINKHIKYFLKIAEKKGFFEMQKNPYLYFKVKQIPSKRDFLDVSEIEKIEKYEFSEAYQHLNKVRDYFMFLIYTGLRYSDFYNLKKENVKKDKNGYYLDLEPIKTETTSAKRVYIPLKFDGKAFEIIEKYKKENSEFIFNDFTNQYLNRELKTISILCEIKKTVTCHVARHTLATFYLNKGVPLVTVSKILGHTSIKTTEIYAKLLNSKIDDDLNKLDFNY